MSRKRVSDALAKANGVVAESVATDDADESLQPVAMRISPPKFELLRVRVRGVTPYVQNRWSEKARAMMKEKQEAGSKRAKGTKREAKDFIECFQAAQYRGLALGEQGEGWYGIPCTAFRNAMIRACSLVGFKMTHAKLTLFVEADGFDIKERKPLVKMLVGEPEYQEIPVRNATGVADIRPLPMWAPGWEAELRVRYDADIFDAADVLNLVSRAGLQVGIGEGRPSAPKSNGMGHGLFEVVDA